MSRKTNYIWRRLDRLKKLNADDVTDVMIRNLGRYYDDMYNNVPYAYGGLQSSIYHYIRNTEHGITVGLGISNTLHENKNPKNPHLDDFTNRELIDTLTEWPPNKKNTAERAKTTLDILNEFRNNTAKDVKEYWRNRLKEV